MKLIFLLALLCGIIGICFGAVSVGFYKDPDHPGKCVINKDLIMSPGEEAKDPNQDCGRLLCGDDSLVQFQTCGVEALPLNCKHGDYVNKDASYPDCCKRQVICE